MKKNINTQTNPPAQSPKTKHGKSARVTEVGAIGIDVGDRTSRYCVISGTGEIITEGSVATTSPALARTFGVLPRCRIALEVGTHSPWVSRLLSSLGHEAIVANARELKAITGSSRKTDRRDARMLARMARADPELLRPIRHRGAEAQAHLTKIRVRAELVETRTSLINAARGLVKAAGERLPDCDAGQMSVSRAAELSGWLSAQIRPLLEVVEELNERIQQCDREVEQIAREQYPETRLLDQVWGVGKLIALTLVLTVEEPHRFARSRDVGCYVGLRPKRSQSGERDPQLGITKEGDIYLRKLLVQGAHRILSRQAPDTDLKRWGLKLAERGAGSAKKRAVVAVARKLAVLLHRLWVTGEVYEPLRNSRAMKAAA